MTSSRAVTRPDIGFVDALAGAGGTADTPSLLWTSELFSDALAAPEADPAPIGAAVRFDGMPSSVRPSAAPRSRRTAVPRSAAEVVSGSAAARSTTASGSAYRAPARPRQAAVPAPVAASATAIAYQQAAAGQYPGGTYAALQGSTPQYAATHYSTPSYHTTYAGTQQSATAPAAPLGRARGGRPPAGVRGQAAKRTSRSGLWSLLVFVVIILFATGLGARIIDAIGSLIQGWTG